MDMHLTMVETTVANPFVPKLRDALQRAIGGEGKLPQDVFAIKGMSGRKYRLFVNNLVETIDDARYLEIGSFVGSTLCSALFMNKVRALAIDNWSQFGGPAAEFFGNLSRFRGDASVSFLDSDFRAVDYSTIGKFNIYLFDGPHTEKDQYEGVTIVLPALEDKFVLIVDDWNWQRVRTGTLKGIRENCLNIDFAAEIRTTLDESDPAVRGPRSDWHNGYFIAACSKSQT